MTESGALALAVCLILAVLAAASLAYMAGRWRP